MPLSQERLIRYDRLVAPANHGAVLVEPPNPVRLVAPCDDATDTLSILDTTRSALRTSLRTRLNLATPVIATGHQPAFVHAGVFAKNVAVDHLVRKTGGSAVFITVDSDLPHATQLVLPQSTSAGLRRVNARIPDIDPRRPYEAQPHTPRDHWLQFFARFASLYEFYDRSLLREFAYAWLTIDDREPDACDAMTRARQATERTLGFTPLTDVRISTIATMPEFRTFVAHCVLHAERLAAAYNQALAGFRRRHRVRAAGRPVPALTRTSDTIELPFWLVRADGPRNRVFARRHDDTIALLAENTAIQEFRVDTLACSSTHDQPWQLEHAGWGVRPRALTLSLFARMFLSNLFIHGIGGAKYDEMMEEFAAEFFGHEPGPTCCVTATLHLPFDHKPVASADIVAARRRARDIRYNPQRHLTHPPANLIARRAELIRRSDELRAQRPRDRAMRRTVFNEIRRVNERILEADPWRAAEYDHQIEQLEAEAAVNDVALDREYFYALHPRAALDELIATLRSTLDAPVEPA